MLVSDLFVSGVFPRDVKAHFGAGLIGIEGAEDERLLAVVKALFIGGEVPRAAEDARAGGVLLREDGAAFRLMCELGRGAVQLARAEAGQYVPVAATRAEAVQVMRTELSTPRAEVFDALFVLGAHDFAEPAAGSASSPSGFMRPAEAGGPQLRGELERLKEERAARSETQALEFELDGLQKKRFTFDELQQRRARLQEKLHGFERELDASRALDAVAEDFSALASSHERTLQKFQDDRNKLLDEQREREARGAPSAPLPLWRDMKLVCGLAAGFGLLGLAAFLQGDLRLIGLLDIAPFGFAAMQALGAVAELEESDRYRQRGRVLDERLKKLEQKREQDTRVVREGMRLAGAENPSEVMAALARRTLARREAQRLREELAAFDQGDGRLLLADELRELDARVKAIEARLEQVGLQLPASEADRRIAELEAELALPGRAHVPLPPPAPMPLRVPPCVAIFRSLAELTGVDAESLAQQMSARVAAYGERLLGVRADVRLDGSGELFLAETELLALPPRERDIMRLSLRLCAYELASAKLAFPLWIDRLERVQTLPHDVLPVYFKHLAKRTQVFWLVAAGRDVSTADARVSLA